MRKTKWKDRINVMPMDYTVFVVTPSSLADFCQWLLDSGCDPVDVVSMQVTWSESLEGGGAMYTTWGSNKIICLPDEFNDELAYHEALHCAINVWDSAGANLKIPRNEEVLTYTQGHIVDLLKKFYAKKEKAKCKTDAAPTC